MNKSKVFLFASCLFIITAFSGCGAARAPKNTQGEATDDPNSIVENTDSQTQPSSTEGGKDKSVGTVFSKYSPIVVESFLMGGLDGEKWLDSNKTFDLINEVEQYKIYDISNSYIGTETGTKVDEQHDIGFTGVTVVLPSVFAASATGRYVYENLLMVSDDRDIWMPIAEKLSNESETYAGFVLEYMALRGYAGLKAPLITELYRVDIDSDGTDEVLINAATDPETVGDTSFVSLLFMRKYINGRVENIVLEEEFHTYTGEDSWSARMSHKILFFCDLNHDGVSEIITRSNGIDTRIYGVYELQGNEFSEVLSNGSGH